jgi:hypothetical protein
MATASERPRLAHRRSGPTGADGLRVETAEDHEGPWQPNWPAGTERRVLYRDPETGGSLTLLRFPAGYDRLDEAAIAAAGGGQRFEHHSCHEEIVCLEGDYTFGEPELYDFSATTYLNHPPYWLHPARQQSNEGVLLLVRNSHPVDFGFCPIAEGWDGVEDYLDEPWVTPSPSQAVTRLRLDDLPLEAVAESGSVLEGARGALLWTDEVLKWETWLIEAVDGTVLADPSGGAGPVGDEWFVLEGGLRFESADGAGAGVAEIGRHGHFCDPQSYPAGGTRVVAAGPVRALRWVAGGRITPAG